MGNFIFSIIWLLILIFISFWIAGLAAGLYIIVLPFTVCIRGLEIMGNFFFSIIWFLILIFFSFWIASFVSWFYILLLPFTVCISALESITDFLLLCVQFPRYCAQAMIDGSGF